MMFLNDRAIFDSINVDNCKQMLLDDSFTLDAISESIDFPLFPSLWLKLITVATVITVIALDIV